MKILRQLFGKRFGISDLILLALVLPAFYFTFKGITFNSGFLAIYMTYISKPLAGAFVFKLIIQNILKSAKK